MDWADRLVRKYRQAWNGLSVLVFAEDSARPPGSYRINYLIILFIACITILVPVSALWSMVVRVTSKTYGQVMSDRIVMLNELSHINDEREELLEKVRDRFAAYQKISSKFQDARIHSLKMSAGSEMPEGSYNSMRVELNSMRWFRERLVEAMEQNRHATSFLEHRVKIYHLTPRGLPLNEDDMLYMGKYGRRTNPVTGVDTEFHEGVDLIAPTGIPIMASAPGEVIEVRNTDGGGYGLMVRIHHGLGFTSLYAHNSENLVKEGDIVKRGQVIAKVGNTGRTIGAHLHYEIKLGPNFQTEPPYRKLRAEDPTEYL